MAHPYLVRHCYIVVAHYIHGAPLVFNSSIALFLVVPPPLVPVRGMNRDQRLPFSPGSCHEPGPMRCLYIPSPASRALKCSVFLWPARGGVCGALAHLLCT